MKSFYWFLMLGFFAYGTIFSFALLFTVSTGSIAIWDIIFSYLPDHKNVNLAPLGLIIIEISSSAVAAFPVLKKLFLRLQNSAILDRPNQRSMHKIPVPRGGGWIFVIASAALLVLYTIDAASPLDRFENEKCLDLNFSIECLAYGNIILPLSILVGLLVLAEISWRDDKQGVAVRWRLLAQLLVVVSSVGVFYWTIFPMSELKDFLIYSSSAWVNWIITIALILAWVWFINLYNFMDGIDGISAVETLSIAGFLLFLPYLGINFRGLELSWPIPIALCGASVAFLQLNWHPARLFMGDVGSVSIGYLLGFFLVVFCMYGLWYVALTLPLYYLADGGITLARRILRGEKFWEAHRTHFYQRAAQAAGRHDVVVLKIAACNVVLIGIAMLELLVSPWFVLAAPLPVALLLHNMAHQRHIGAKSPNG